MPKKQPALPGLDIDTGELDKRYARFGEFPDDYPKGTYAIAHPAFARSGNVIATGRHEREIFVDLTIGECECQQGWAFARDAKDNRKWYQQAHCTHKLRLMASVMDAAPPQIDPIELRRGYFKALASRYNRFEVVSAFHKELRRGDTKAAWFWGVILSTYRSIRGVIDYLLNIIYEETRDHDLHLYLIKLRKNFKRHTMAEMSTAIVLFCASIKKWEMPRRLTVFENEMRGYKRLADKYGWDVAKGGNIIADEAAKKRFVKALRDGVAKQDEVLFQEGLKGLQKLNFIEGSPDPNDYYDYRYWMYETLFDIAEKLLPPTHDVWTVIEVINVRINEDLGIGYHELNCIGDAMLGEPYTSGLLDPAKRLRLLKRPPMPAPIGTWPAMPLYANDNHTYRGKALIKRYGDQLKPSVKQTDLDFRWCGAYFGVAYRMLSYAQHGTVSEWEETVWPKWLYGIVRNMFY